MIVQNLEVYLCEIGPSLSNEHEFCRSSTGKMVQSDMFEDQSSNPLIVMPVRWLRTPEHTLKEDKMKK